MYDGMFMSDDVKTLDDDVEDLVAGGIAPVVVVGAWQLEASLMVQQQAPLQAATPALAHRTLRQGAAVDGGEDRV